MQKTNPYLILIIIYIILGVFGYQFTPDFVNSNFLVTSTTAIVGSLALFIYTKQKEDEKTNAALSILFEVRNAEENLEILRGKINSSDTIDLPSVLPVNSWVKYSHLFAKDFDNDELKLMNNFYNTCVTIEDLSNRQNDFIWVAAEERARTAQRLLGDIHVEFQRDVSNGISLEDAQNKFNNEKQGITQFYGDEGYFYAPKKTIQGLEFEITKFQKVTTTTCGSKLKKLAKV